MLIEKRRFLFEGAGEFVPSACGNQTSNSPSMSKILIFAQPLFEQVVINMQVMICSIFTTFPLVPFPCSSSAVVASLWHS